MVLTYPQLRGIREVHNEQLAYPSINILLLSQKRTVYNQLYLLLLSLTTHTADYLTTSKRLPLGPSEQPQAAGTELSNQSWTTPESVTAVPSHTTFAGPLVWVEHIQAIAPHTDPSKLASNWIISVGCR